jgi:hypothetical protein
MSVKFVNWNANLSRLMDGSEAEVDRWLPVVPEVAETIAMETTEHRIPWVYNFFSITINIPLLFHVMFHL